MPNWLETAKKWLYQVVEIGLVLIALGIVLQILFGSGVAFLPGDIVGNLIGLVNALGQNGVVGLVVVAIILWLFWKRSPS